MALAGDARWAQDRGLDVTIDGTVLRLSGSVGFRAHYNSERLIYGDDIPPLVNADAIIEDAWRITLIYDYRGDFVMPIVFDNTGRIKKTMKKHRINDARNMHINDGPHMPSRLKGSFCVALKSELEKAYALDFDLEHYFSQYLIPFLFQQSYFERKRKWPWVNYPHGLVGERLAQMERRLI